MKCVIFGCIELVICFINVNFEEYDGLVEKVISCLYVFLGFGYELSVEIKGFQYVDFRLYFCQGSFSLL